MAKKEKLSIEDLQSREDAYGHELTNGKIIKIILPYLLIMGTFSVILYMSIPITLLIVLLSALYGYKMIVPREISVQYYRKSYNQRHQLIIALNQSLSDTTKPIAKSLSDIAVTDLEGEFQTDIQRLVGKIYATTNESALHKEFVRLENKYKGDTLFREFIEQIENRIRSNSGTNDSFADIARNHTLTFQIQEEYIEKRNKHRKNFYTIVFFLILLVGAMAISSQGIGFESIKVWRDTFAHSWIGIADSTIFLLILTKITDTFYKMYYDEDLNHI